MYLQLTERHKRNVSYFVQYTNVYRYIILDGSLDSEDIRIQISHILYRCSSVTNVTNVDIHVTIRVVAVYMAWKMAKNNQVQVAVNFIVIKLQ